MTERRCDKCEFYSSVRLGRSESFATCRVRSVVNSTFPTRFPEDWCGEFQPAAGKEPFTFCGTVKDHVLTDQTATIRCDDAVPEIGTRVEMRIVGGG